MHICYYIRSHYSIYT